MQTHFESIELVEPTRVKVNSPHIIVTGQTGKGKGNVSERICENLIGKEKVIDLYDQQGRMENCLYSIPENDAAKIAKLKELSAGKEEPRGYESEILMFPGALLKKIRKLPKNIRLVSLDPEILTIENMIHLVARTESTRTLLQWINYEQGDMGLNELFNYVRNLDDKMAHANSKWSILRNLSELKNSGMFSDKVPRLDLKQTFKEKDRLTAINNLLQNSDAEIAACQGLILQQSLELIQRHSFGHGITFYIREISDIFDSQYADKSFHYPQKYIWRLYKSGRDRKIRMIVDSARLVEVPKKIRKQAATIIMLGSHFDDAMALRELQWIPQKTLLKIPYMSRGSSIQVINNTFKYPVFHKPTRHLKKYPGLNVMNLLGDRFGWQAYDANTILGLDNKRPKEKEAVQGKSKDSSESIIEKDPAAELGAII